MKKKILKIFVTLLVIMSLLVSDFAMLGKQIVNAVYEELETQPTQTNIKNVEFDAYFLSDGEKKHSKENGLETEETLVLNVNVKEKGVLNEAKIKIENANFEMINDKVENNYVKNINQDTNEIELNEIIYQNNVTIEIPIRFKKQVNFAEDYFEKENTISITGTYEDTRTQNVSGQVKTRMIWKLYLLLNEYIFQFHLLK